MMLDAAAREGRLFCGVCDKGYTAWTQCVARDCPSLGDLVERIAIEPDPERPLAGKSATQIIVDEPEVDVPARTVAHVARIFEGRDGAATQGLYGELHALGPAGLVATNLLRAQKNSTLAKGYRKGSATRAAYDTKQWAMGELCAALLQHHAELGIAWGWGRDEKTSVYSHVLYVELPTGQASFHTEQRGLGPDFTGAWDGIKDASARRIIRYAALVLARAAAPAETA